MFNVYTWNLFCSIKSNLNEKKLWGCKNKKNNNKEYFLKNALLTFFFKKIEREINLHNLKEMERLESG